MGIRYNPQGIMTSFRRPGEVRDGFAPGLLSVQNGPLSVQEDHRCEAAVDAGSPAGFRFGGFPAAYRW
ncbi:MAG: hypothetical protein LBG84_01725 [Treponema sp.]|nr:hypothetical protein [Treponema sp.]